MHSFLLSFRKVHKWSYSRKSTNFNMLFIWSSIFKSLSVVIPSIFSDWLFLIWTSLLLTANSLLVLNNTWHLFALAFTSWSLHHWKIAQATSSKSLTTEKMLSPVTSGVLSSAKLATWNFSIMKKRLHWRILKKSDPNIEPCGTPEIISFQELYSLPILVLWKRYDK